MVHVMNDDKLPKVVGIASIQLNDEGLFLRVILEDGSIAKTWWTQDRMRSFLEVAEAPRPALLTAASVN
jgi:hypothetical protein